MFAVSGYDKHKSRNSFKLHNTISSGKAVSIDISPELFQFCIAPLQSTPVYTDWFIVTHQKGVLE